MPTTLNPEPITPARASTNVGASPCPLCGAPLHDPAACDQCDWIQGYGQQPPAMRRNPRDVFACVLSLFWPGAGHFYKGHVKIAAVLAVLGLLCFLWSITFLMFAGPLVLPVFWLGVAANAYFLEDLKHPAAGV